MTTQTLTITEFLLARIAEDEAVAGYGESARGDDWALGWVYDQGDAIEIRRSRVLAECEAHRRIVEEHTSDWIGCERCVLGVTVEWGDPEVDYYDGPCLTMRALASVYADHPDYREEWRV
jgi:hypothetical protein